jgi:hypothetical protein
MLYLANAFSLSMISKDDVVVRIKEIDVEEAKKLIKTKFISAVGHAATASILSELLKTEIPMNRVSIKLEESDSLIVFQLLTRLEEGRVLTAEEIATLPFKFFLVETLPSYTIEALYHW